MELNELTTIFSFVPWFSERVEIISMCMMSHLIRIRRAMTYTPSPTATPSSTTTPTTASTAPADMDHWPVNPGYLVGPPVRQAQASSTSSVALPVSA
ncbi:hypothetical protein DVH24_014547 [Malus domestica]|uniref:Uncharacterized protein n=1 Tax=Malus domestica TaxID=3750 RepID=A0A498KLC4_MALDO|nr:hypothetical protein DVH24_014547 [Malus domestica]